MVDLAAGGGEEEGGVGKREQLGKLVGIVVIELSLVAAGKLVEAILVVVSPLAQLGARRDVLEPLVVGQVTLGDAPRPHPIHQHPSAFDSVLALDYIVNLRRLKH